MKTISIGKQNFASLREQDYFYIDKTGFIKEWWESGDEITLITRPRRFGKTLNMTMLECFFSNAYAGRGELFEGLSIWREEKYRRLQGTCPVVFLSFADVKANTCSGVIFQMKNKITALYNQYDFLLDSDCLNPMEKAQFAGISWQMDDETAATALQTLMGYLSRYYGKKIIVLLDEYDTPMQEAYLGGYWTELTSFFRILFNATLKTNPYLERGLMTGITRVSKESVFSDLNNLKVVTTTSESYAMAFGFTEEEVYGALDEAGLSGEKEEVRFWYDGFTFGSCQDIYNPWSITNFLKEKEYSPYWADTSSNGLVDRLIRQGDVGVKQTMEELLAGKAVCTQLDEQIVFDQLDGSVKALWSMLLASGYLKVAGYTKNLRTRQKVYELKLTNFEVELMFEKMIAAWFDGQNTRYQDFVKALLKGNLEEMNYYMNKVALATFSTFDSGNQPSEQAEPERFYHGFVLGLLVERRDDYLVTSNRESGLGRYDVVMKPLRRELPAIVMEFKVRNPDKEASLLDTVAAAHRQMQEKNYDAGLLAEGIARERIFHYGFAFQGKQVLIG
ncbi:MAG: AAA family ATPase [Lachnospiraceae bacterium]|nr:AAA family ATPase [Lachnospiraceae bacterium]MCI9150105.1 AAA family ATPase [Lachnospiraceae bacterium]